HRVVGNKDVRRSRLHIPSRPHLAPVGVRKVVSQLLDFSQAVAFHSGAPCGVDLRDDVPKLPFLVSEPLAEVLDAGGRFGVPMGVEGRVAPGYRGRTRVGAECDPVPASFTVQPAVDRWVIERLAESSELIFNESVEWVEDDRPKCVVAVYVFP